MKEEPRLPLLGYRSFLRKEVHPSTWLLSLLCICGLVGTWSLYQKAVLTKQKKAIMRSVMDSEEPYSPEMENEWGMFSEEDKKEMRKNLQLKEEVRKLKKEGELIAALRQQDKERHEAIMRKFANNEAKWKGGKPEQVPLPVSHEIPERYFFYGQSKMPLRPEFLSGKTIFPEHDVWTAIPFDVNEDGTVSDAKRGMGLRLPLSVSNHKDEEMQKLEFLAKKKLIPPGVVYLEWWIYSHEEQQFGEFDAKSIRASKPLDKEKIKEALKDFVLQRF